MTFESAINGLTNGKAAKLSTWGGYIRKTVITTGIPEFVSTSTYSLGQLVTHGGSTYICTTAVTQAGEWNFSNWTATEKYTLTFRKRQNVEGSPIDVDYTYTPTLVSGAIVYKVEPDGIDSDSSEEAHEWLDMMPLDGSLLQAMCSNDWVIGDASSFEEARTGTAIW